MIRFEVLQPETLDQAIQMLVEHGQEARVLAGGTDLVVALRFRNARPKYMEAFWNLVNWEYVAGNL